MIPDPIHISAMSHDMLLVRTKDYVLYYFGLRACSDCSISVAAHRWQVTMVNGLTYEDANSMTC